MKNSGKLLVFLLLTAAVAATAATWWHYREQNPSTRDAVLIMPAANVELPTTPAPVAASTPAPADIEQLERKLAAAEAELVVLREGYAASREAIEEAVEMVREQRENFEFAHDRYERLMPLVETGALDPLSASQIQSAYISARASLAQANFYLGEARRAFGPREVRAARMAMANLRVERANQAVAEARKTAANSPPETSPPADDDSHPRPPVIEAHFPSAATLEILPGMQAWVTVPAQGRARLKAVVLGTAPPTNNTSRKVMLRLADPPQLPQGRRIYPCHVTIDTTLPVVGGD